MITPVVAELAERRSTARTCALLGKPRTSHYRLQQPRVPAQPRKHGWAPNALSDAERARVLEVLTRARFADK